MEHLSTFYVIHRSEASFGLPFLDWSLNEFESSIYCLRILLEYVMRCEAQGFPFLHLNALPLSWINALSDEKIPKDTDLLKKFKQSKIILNGIEFCFI